MFIMASKSDAAQPKAPDSSVHHGGDVRINHGHLFLSTKPSAALAFSRVGAIGEDDMSNILVVFLNGLVLPKSVWLPVLSAILDSLAAGAKEDARPEFFAYDRFGQGLSDADPLDLEPGKEPGYGHGILDVVADLHEVIHQIQNKQAGNRPRKRLMFVASSIGCAFARLYAQTYQGTVAGIVFLDSMMANQNFIDMFPDPASPGFDPGALPDGITPSILEEQRRVIRARFAPDVKNRESLDRRNLSELLPESDAPPLLGYEGKSPLLTVVGHDKETFARQSWEGDMKTPIAFTQSYTQPVWERYNDGLRKLSDRDRVRGVLIAQNCGHFIPMDDPAQAAAMTVDMIQRLVKE